MQFVGAPLSVFWLANFLCLCLLSVLQRERINPQQTTTGVCCLGQLNTNPQRGCQYSSFEYFPSNPLSNGYFSESSCNCFLYSIQFLVIIRAISYSRIIISWLVLEVTYFKGIKLINFTFMACTLCLLFLINCFPAKGYRTILLYFLLKVLVITFMPSAKQVISHQQSIVVTSIIVSF